MGIGRIEIVNNKKTYVSYKKIGRIEIVNGEKTYVPYSDENGGGCEGPAESTNTTLDDVQDLVLEENFDNLTLTWKDPDDVVFNGNTIAEWAGTKVIRKEGSPPKNINDGILITDSKVKNQYAETGIEDDGTVSNVTYNYALFPYTSKNIYTFSDLNRVSGSPGNYSPVLQDNSWSTIQGFSSLGMAESLWKVGDVKDNYVIVGFNHDNLADESGKAGITFALKQTTGESSMWGTPSANLLYVQSEYYKKMQAVYDSLDSDLKRFIKKVKKLCKNSYSTNANCSEYEMFLFPFANVEIFGNDGKVGQYFLGEGEKYIGSDILQNDLSFGSSYMTRTFAFNKCFWYVAGGALKTYGMQYDYIKIRYGFCI